MIFLDQTLPSMKATAYFLFWPSVQRSKVWNIVAIFNCILLLTIDTYPICRLHQIFSDEIKVYTTNCLFCWPIFSELKARSKNQEDKGKDWKDELVKDQNTDKASTMWNSNFSKDIVVKKFTNINIKWLVGASWSQWQPIYKEGCLCTEIQENPLHIPPSYARKLSRRLGRKGVWWHQTKSNMDNEEWQFLYIFHYL